tara:strand:- start:2313 stop:2552 length:240 start_codon:yes stop_codon:yes gene_type:complete
MYREEENDFDIWDREITLEELSKEIDKEEGMMSEQEKFCRMRDGDPTFLMFAHSSMIHQKMDKAIINEHTQKIEKVSTD